MRLAAKAQSDNKSTVCPECCEVIDISDVNALRPAFFINRLQPVVPLKDEGITSELERGHQCEMRSQDVEPAGTPVAFCCTCNRFICQYCEQVHHSVKDCRGHEVIPLESCSSAPPPGVIKDKYLRCDKHGEIRKLFCGVCNKLICIECALTSHKKHDCEDVDAECIRKCTDDLKLRLQPLQKLLAKILDAIRKFEERKRVIESQASGIANKIHQAFDKVNPMYLDCRDTTLSHLYQMEGMKVKAISSQKKPLEVTLSDLECLLQLGNQILKKDSGDKLNFLSQLEDLTLRISAFNQEDTAQLIVEPRTDSNIAIEIVDPIPANVAEEYCRLYLLQPHPSRCSASGIGLQDAETANITEFHFHLKYANGLPCSEEQIISVCIHSLVRGPVEAQVSYQGNGDYKVTYTPTTRGRHEVRVVVNGEEISGSPFQLFVSNPPLLLRTPVRVIKSHSKIDGLTMNADGQLIVSEKMKGEISIWDKTGTKLKVIQVREFLRCHVHQTPFLCRPTGVAVDREGCIYVSDNSSHCLVKFSKEGSKLLKIICKEGAGNGELDSPGGIRVSEKGEVFVCDCANHRVQVFCQNLQFQRSFGENGSDCGEFNWPVDLDFDSSGYIYVSDMNNHRIQVFDAEEKFVRSFGTRGSQPGNLCQPVFLFIDRSNYLYISENVNHRVSIFRTNGDFVRVLGGKGEQEGMTTSPKGITMDKDGFLYIGERANKRIQIF